MPAKRILIIEPDPKSRFALTAVLEHHGHAVCSVASPDGYSPDASPLDVLLLDLYSPVFPAAFLRRLTAQNPALRIMIMTANELPSLHLPFLPAATFVKPLDIHALLAAIAQ